MGPCLQRGHTQMCACNTHTHTDTHIRFSPKETFVLHEQLDKLTGLRACACVTLIGVCVC